MLYELVMKYTLHEQECNNRFHFTSPATGDLAGGAEDLTGGFIAGSLITALVAWWTSTDSVDFHTVTTRALYDPTDFWEETAIGGSGTATDGESMASAYALGFRSARFRTGRNRGYKRFSGMGENAVAGNDYILPLQAGDVSAALNDLVTGDTLGELYGPRVLLLDEPSPGVYKIYPTEAEQRSNMSGFGLAWDANTFVTTQRSRLPGHGA